MSMPKVRPLSPCIGIFEPSRDKDMADLIFEEWKSIRNNLVNNLDSVNILTSKQCMSKNVSNTNPLFKNEHCEGCLTIKNFIEDDFIDKNKEILIQTGENKGNIMKMFSYKNTNVTIKDEQNNMKIYNPFLNYVVVSCIMENILQNKKYPTTVPYLWSYICEDTFNVIIDIKNMKTLKELSMNPSLSKSSPLAKRSVNNILNEKITKDIFSQTVLLCYFYTKYNFSHGEPSLQYINFSSRRTNFVFQGININSPVTLSISPSTKSSIEYKNKRYHLYKDRDTFIDIPLESKDIGLDNSHYTGNYEDHRVVYYKIGNQSDKFLNLKNTGGKYFFPSFDCIMFLSSLFTDKSYQESMKGTNLLYIWKNLWKDHEYDNLVSDLKKIDKNTFKNVFNVVKKYHMRSDTLEYCVGCLHSI